MKKYFLVVFCALLLFVTGCGNKNQVVCTGSETEDGVEVKTEIIADFDDSDKLTDATVVYDLGSSENADKYCSIFKLMESAAEGVSVNCSGAKITINGYAKAAAAEDEEDNMIGKTKEEFKQAMKEESEGRMTCK